MYLLAPCKTELGNLRDYLRGQAQLIQDCPLNYLVDFLASNQVMLFNQFVTSVMDTLSLPFTDLCACSRAVIAPSDLMMCACYINTNF